MKQDTKPAPFNVGDHVRYVGKRRVLSAGQGNAPELTLVSGMEGVILISTGLLADQGAAASKPWHCRAQFHNGFQLDITPENGADFEMAGVADTVTLHYSEAGRGTSVVLLHGFPLSGAIWQAQQKQLAEQYRVIVPDLRGHGKSPAPPGAYDMSLLARDVLAMLDSLQIKKAVIMGHSMGGYVALAALRLAPERFLALGLIASQAGADSDEARQGRYRIAEKVAAAGSNAMAEAMLPKLFAPTLPAAAPIVEQVRQLILKTAPTGIIGALQGLAIRPDAHALLSNLTLPVLLLAGEQDQIIALEKPKALASSLKTMATLTTIANAGHMPMLEQPDATTAAMRQFLSKLGA